MSDLVKVMCTATGERLGEVHPFEEERTWFVDTDAIMRYGQAVADDLCEQAGLPPVKVVATSDRTIMRFKGAWRGKQAMIEVGPDGLDLALMGEPFEAVIAHEIGHHHYSHTLARRAAQGLADAGLYVLVVIALSFVVGLALSMVLASIATRNLASQVVEFMCDRYAARWRGAEAMIESLTAVEDEHDRALRTWRPWRTHPPMAARLWMLARVDHLVYDAPSAVVYEHAAGLRVGSLDAAA